MRKRFISTLVIGAAALCLAACASAPHAPARADVAPLSLIPAPAQTQRANGHFTLDANVPLIANGDAAATVARGFAERLERSRGIALSLRSGDAQSSSRAIEFVLDGSLPSSSDEAYELSVDVSRMRIRARSAHGLFAGGVTLWQLLTQDATKTARIDVPALRIEDAPRFAWRGVMLDSARHFQPPDFVKHFIDEIALLKFNTLHWHLTDDQGWRIEIKRYPRLTQVGAWRDSAGEFSGTPTRVGGFYTQDEIRDIVHYAAQRHVTIVPEVDMPGHMQAAIAAYPELGSLGDTPVVSTDWGVHPYLLNVDDKTFEFVDGVLDEVMQLFPSPIIHIGGDEALKDQWKASPRVQARMHELGLRDENALQGWFIARVEQYLAAHGRRAIGWDEILEGGVPANAIVMSWRGSDGGIAAAKAGHDVVMSPSPDLYFDHLQSDAPDEPSGRPDVRSLADLYAYEPQPPSLDARASTHILGAQANLWTEHMRTPALVEHAAFPRLAALAEVLWSPHDARDWNGFLARLPAQYARWQADGVAASRTAFEVRASIANGATPGTFAVTLTDQAGVPIRFTLDGDAPASSSPIYRDVLSLKAGTTLRAAAFVGTDRIGDERRVVVSRDMLLERSSDALRQCAGKLTLRLAGPTSRDAPTRYINVDLFDPCWLWPQAPLDGVRDIAIDAAPLRYNFQLAHDITSVAPRPAPSTPHGELIVSRDGCDGERVATVPLPARTEADGAVRLIASLPPTSGAHDLCFRFSGRSHDPLWAIDRVRLETR